jgi:hypothetical protein
MCCVFGIWCVQQVLPSVAQHFQYTQIGKSKWSVEDGGHTFRDEAIVGSSNGQELFDLISVGNMVGEA